MDENILKFRVGIFVVIAMLILGILIFLNSEGWTRQYTIFIKAGFCAGRHGRDPGPEKRDFDRSSQIGENTGRPCFARIGDQ